MRSPAGGWAAPCSSTGDLTFGAGNAAGIELPKTGRMCNEGFDLFVKSHGTPVASGQWSVVSGQWRLVMGSFSFLLPRPHLL